MNDHESKIVKSADVSRRCRCERCRRFRALLGSQRDADVLFRRLIRHELRWKSPCKEAAVAGVRPSLASRILKTFELLDHSGYHNRVF